MRKGRAERVVLSPPVHLHNAHTRTDCMGTRHRNPWSQSTVHRSDNNPGLSAMYTHPNSACLSQSSYVHVGDLMEGLNEAIVRVVNGS